MLLLNPMGMFWQGLALIGVGVLSLVLHFRGFGQGQHVVRKPPAGPAFSADDPEVAALPPTTTTRLREQVTRARERQRRAQDRVTLMPNNRSPMRLSPDEELFLRHWMYDEVHYEEGPGPAKRLQVEHRAIPGELAILIAAAIPDPLEQERAGLDRPPAGPPQWPWSEESLRRRVSEARSVLSAEPMGRLQSPRP